MKTVNKIAYLVLLLVTMMNIRAMKEITEISSSIAQSWQEIEPYKATVCFPFLKQYGIEQEHLEEAWQSFESFFKAKPESILLLKKGDKPVAFLAVETQDKNALIYIWAALLPNEELNRAVAQIKDHYPKVSKVYCLGRQDEGKPNELARQLGWTVVKSSPIEPNKILIENKPYLVFYKALKSSTALQGIRKQECIIN